MTAVPPRRRQQPLNLEGAWLVTESPDGAKEVPGMSVVADARGFTLTGPEPGAERTIPWALTTGFTCQRPARLPDGSPATMLEVGLANGRVLQLMLPVNRVPPSETVVVETELAVMSEQYGGQRPPVTQPEAAVAQETNPGPQHARKPAGQAHDSSADRRGTLRYEMNEQARAAAGRGPDSNGPSGNGSLVGRSPAKQSSDTELSRRTTGLGVAFAPAERAPSPAPAVVQEPAPAQAAPAQAAPAPASVPAPAAPAPASVPAPAMESAPALTEGPAVASGPAPEAAPAFAVEVEDAAAPAPTPVAAAVVQPGVVAQSPELQPAGDTGQESGDSPSDRRETRLLYMLVALIGVVVVVLILELVLILFVLNHNTTSHNNSSIRLPTVLVHSPLTRADSHVHSRTR